MDEPTAGLDSKQRVIVRRLTENLGKDKIVIVSTHIISDIESIDDNIILIRQGELIENGTVDKLIQKVNSGEKNWRISICNIMEEIKMLKAEIKKLLLFKTLWVLLAYMICINRYERITNAYNRYYTPKEYTLYFSELDGMTTQEAMDYSEKKLKIQHRIAII